MATMICTNCFCDTGVSPDFGDLSLRPGGVAAIIALCREWKCNACLDDAEWAEESERAYAAEDPMREVEA